MSSYDDIRAAVDQAEREYNQLSSDLQASRAAFDALQKEFDAYKESHPDTQPPSPPAVELGLGMYNGNPSENPDEDYKNQFGSYPVVTSSYYTSNPPNEKYETARVQRGTDVWMDFDTKNTAGLIGQIADRNSSALTNWLYPNLDAAQKVAAAGKAKGGGQVTISFVHEWEVKVAQNKFTNTRDRNPLVFAAAFDVFISEARKRAPDVKVALWMGNSAANWKTNIGTAINAMKQVPDKVSWDPYVTVNRSSSTTPLELFKPTHDWWEANKPSTWKVSYAITEFGIATQHGDAAGAAFYSKVKEAMKALNIVECLQFNRDKGEANGNWKITGSATPKTKAAFKAEVDDIKAG